MDGGKLGKYLRYAIGEIILVVIGILIALQINSWAGDRKDRAFEKVTLAQIQSSLKRDHEVLEQIHANRVKAVLAIESILALDRLGGNQEKLDTWLGDVIQFDRFNSITNAYEVLKSRGLELVRDDELRLELGIYYDGWAKEILAHIHDLEKTFFDIWMPMILNDFDSFEYTKTARPSDLSAFLSNRVVLSSLRFERENHRATAADLQEMMDFNIKLQALIASELKN